MLEKTTRDCQTDRRHFIGGSDARIIMGQDEKALVRLWQEKRGEVGPEDLSGNLIVQFGLATEDLNRTSKSVAPPASLAGFPKGPSRLRRCGNSPARTARRRAYRSFSVALTDLWRARFGAGVELDAPPGSAECAAASLVRRTPGCSPFVNSTPAASSARRMTSRVARWGVDFPFSKLRSVTTLRRAAAAISAWVQFNSPRAARH
jgi:hypothetical protein